MKDTATGSQGVFRAFAPEMGLLREQALELEEALLSTRPAELGKEDKQKYLFAMQGLDLMIQTLAALEQVFEQLSDQSEPNLQAAASGVTLEKLRGRLAAE